MSVSHPQLAANTPADSGLAAPAHRPVVLHTRVVSGTGGGPDKTIINSAYYLREGRYRLLCGYMRDPRDRGFEVLAARAAAKQAQLVVVDDRGPFDLSLVRRWADVCRREQPAIWHGHDYKSNLLGLWLRRRFPMKLVTTVHGWVKFTKKTPLYYAIDRWCLPRYDQVICVSEDLYDACLRLGVPADRLIHIPNAIDTEEFTRRETTLQAQQRLGVPAGRMVIGSIGRLSAEKRFDLLIRAVPRLVAAGLDVQLWIVGEGDQQQPLANLVTQLGLADRVRLWGFHANPVELYPAMDLFALASDREGLPNVLLEAMALETPVLATRIAGIPKLIADDVDGLLIPPGDLDQLTAALQRLLADSALRQRLAHAAREKIVRDFSFARRMQRVQAVYDRVLGLAPEAAP